MARRIDGQPALQIWIDPVLRETITGSGAGKRATVPSSPPAVERVVAPNHGQRAAGGAPSGGGRNVAYRGTPHRSCRSLPTARAYRKYPARRSRGTISCHDQWSGYRRVTQAKQPPETPARFTLLAKSNPDFWATQKEPDPFLNINRSFSAVVAGDAVTSSSVSEVCCGSGRVRCQIDGIQKGET